MRKLSDVEFIQKILKVCRQPHGRNETLVVDGVSVLINADDYWSSLDPSFDNVQVWFCLGSVTVDEARALGRAFRGLKPTVPETVLLEFMFQSLRSAPKLKIMGSKVRDALVKKGINPRTMIEAVL